MVPRHDESLPSVRPVSPRLRRLVRSALVVLAAGLITVFVVAARLHPYDADGRALRLAVHEQLGFKPCHFVNWFDRPCPTCGMTTSFALFVRGDVVNSWRANWAGTLLAVYFLVLLLLGLHAAVRGRWWFGHRTESWLLGGIIVIIVLTAVRWIAVIGVPWLFGG